MMAGIDERRYAQATKLSSLAHQSAFHVDLLLLMGDYRIFAAATDQYWDDFSSLLVIFSINIPPLKEGRSSEQGPVLGAVVLVASADFTAPSSFFLLLSSLLSVG
jgi:hypothetical protein